MRHCKATWLTFGLVGLTLRTTSFLAALGIELLDDGGGTSVVAVNVAVAEIAKLWTVVVARIPGVRTVVVVPARGSGG